MPRKKKALQKKQLAAEEALASEPSSAPNGGSCLASILQIPALVTWQLVALVALFVFYTPARDIASLLPKKVEQANDLTFGNFLTIKLAQQAEAVGNPELAGIIGGLSTDAVEWILKLGTGSYRVIFEDAARPGVPAAYGLAPGFTAWLELGERGLLESTQDLKEYKAYFESLGPIDGKLPSGMLDAEQQSKLKNNSVRLSELGRNAYEIILKVIADSIGACSAPSAAEPTPQPAATAAQ